MIIRELLTNLSFKVDNSKLRSFNRQMKRAKEMATKTTEELNNIARGVRNIGAGLTVGITLPVVLLGKSMVTAASDAEESNQKFDVVFGNLRKESNKTADTFAKDFGLATSTSKELLGSTGDLLTGFGFTQERALSLADEVQRLGGDLASFQNIQGGARVAGERLTKGILGETENLKTLGIVVRQDTKEFKNMVKQIQVAEKVTEQQAKVLTIFRMATNQSKNAIGDFARTQDSAANQMKIAGERIKNLRERFGKLLLPIVVKVTRVLIRLVDFLSNLPKPIKAVILLMAGFAAVVGPLVLILGLLAQALIAIKVAAIALAPILSAFGVAGLVALAPLLLKLALIATALAAIGTAIFLVIDDFNVWRAGGESVIGKLIGSFERFKMNVMRIFNGIKTLFSLFWSAVTKGGKEEWEAFSEFLIGSVIKMAKIIGQIWNVLWNTVIPKILSASFKLLGSLINGLVTTVIPRILSSVFFLVESLVKGVAKRLIDKFPVISKLVDLIPERTKGVSAPLPRLGPLNQFNPLAQSASGNTSNNQNNTTTVEINAPITVPPGTNTEQLEAIRAGVREELGSAINDTITANPRLEQ